MEKLTNEELEVEKTDIEDDSIEPSIKNKEDEITNIDVEDSDDNGDSISEGTKPLSKEEVIEILRKVKEDAGQISELSSEEDKIVKAFSLALLNLMQAFAKSIPIAPSVIPREFGRFTHANLIPRGELLVLHGDGRMSSFSLGDELNRDLLISVIRDAMPKFNDLLAQRKSDIEKRIDFLSSITKELQNVSETLVSSE